MFISNDRKNDIKKRGKRCRVYDIDGKVVYLGESRVWFDNQGVYFKPISYEGVCDICAIS